VEEVVQERTNKVSATNDGYQDMSALAISLFKNVNIQPYSGLYRGSRTLGLFIFGHCYSTISTQATMTRKQKALSARTPTKPVWIPMRLYDAQWLSWYCN